MACRDSSEPQALSIRTKAIFLLEIHPDEADNSERMIEPERVRKQLGKICASPQFRSTSRLRDFLVFIVDEVLAGHSSQIKEYSVATSVYERPVSFDPKLDSIVRVEAIKLRARLEAYYTREGSSDELTIRVPKGGYVPEFGRPK